MKDPIPFPNPDKPGHPAEEAVATLRAIAQLPAPEGLKERVKAGLLQGLHRGLPPAADDAELDARGWMHSAAVRGLAAAAIVLIVVGGGWGAAHFGRRSTTPQAFGIPRVAPQGNFSNAGAMRTPQTLTPPAAPQTKNRAYATNNHASRVGNAKREKPLAKDVQAGKASTKNAPERR